MTKDSVRRYYAAFRGALVKAKNNGFFHIIVSSSLVKVVSFISAMFLPRVVADKSDYGLLVYVDNIRGYIMLINGIGIANATLRYCAKEDDEGKKKGYFLASLAIGIAFDVLMIAASAAVFILVPFTFAGASELLLLLSVLPLFAFLFEDIQLFLRACFENKKFSALSLFYTVLMVLGQIGFALLWGLKGVVLGRYVAAALAVLMGFVFIKSLRLMKARAVFPEKRVLKSMIWFGIVMLLSSSVSYMMQLNETLVLSLMLKDETALADYRIASYIMTVSTFIVQSVAVFIFPYFTRHMHDKEWVWRNFKKVLSINAMVMVPVHIGLVALTRPFIAIVFGEQYLNAAAIMQTLLIASLGQTTLRMLTGNILAATGEERFNLKINILFMIIHVAADVWAISALGIYGAAIALSVVYYMSGVIMILHLRRVCRKDRPPTAAA